MLKIQLEPSASDSLSGSPPAPPAWPGMLLFSVVIKLGDYLDSKRVPECIIFFAGRQQQSYLERRNNSGGEFASLSP